MSLLYIVIILLRKSNISVNIIVHNIYFINSLLCLSRDW